MVIFLRALIFTLFLYLGVCVPDEGFEDISTEEFDKLTNIVIPWDEHFKEE